MRTVQSVRKVEPLLILKAGWINAGVRVFRASVVSSVVAPIVAPFVALIVALVLISAIFAEQSHARSDEPNENAQTRPEGKKLGDGVYQLTGTHLQVGYKAKPGEEVPDPAPPYVNKKGEIEIYGSALYFLRYRDWNTFLEAGSYERVELDLRGPTGRPYRGDYTHPWDVRKYRLVYPDGRQEEILLGGAMTPPAGTSSPRWPQDNPSRRIYIFRQNSDGSWQREADPIYGSITTGWMGHSYGGNFFSPDENDPSVLRITPDKKMYYFFEQVDLAVGDNPTRTQIYTLEAKFEQKKARLVASTNPIDQLTFGLTELSSQVAAFVPRFTNALLAIGIFKPDGKTPYPSTVRSVGGHLVEGPRPTQVKIAGRTFYFVGFSGGDFCTDGYTVNYAWSTKPEGPYQPILTSDGSDFVNFSAGFQRLFNLSWVGRPVLYQIPDGNYEMMFHAVDKTILPDNNYREWPKVYSLSDFYRILFKTRIRFDLNPDGSPRIILDGHAIPATFRAGSNARTL